MNSENTGTADEDASQEDTSVNVRESKKNCYFFLLANLYLYLTNIHSINHEIIPC